MTNSHYTLHPQERASIEAFLEPGTHVGYLGNPDYNRAWSILHQEPGRVLLEHWNHALAWVEVKEDHVVSYRLLEGDAARAERALYVSGE